MLDLFPAGFEERAYGEEIELAGYVDSDDAERMCARIEGASAADVAPGWDTAWQRFHQPVRIGDVWLGPPWETPPHDAVAVWIRPGMAFGTGAHATTRLCIELLLEEPPGMLVDVGCGSGVLAVTGARLGFDPVLAIDIDSVAVEETREHARRNGVEIDVRHGDAVRLELERLPLLVANVPLVVLERSLEALRPMRAIVSGVRVGDITTLRGYSVASRRQSDGWEAARLERDELAGANGVYS